MSRGTREPCAVSLPAGVVEAGAGAGDVEVWSLALAPPGGEAVAGPATGTGGASDASVSAEGLVELSPEEIERSGRISSDEARWRYLESHVWLRRLLAARLGIAPIDVSYRRGATGKPELVRGGYERVRFNMSRSGDMALYVISARREVGIDVQECVAGTDLRRLGRRFLSEGEKEVLATLEEHERRRAFYRTWVRKEAFLKAVGVGLAVAWSAVDTSVDFVRIEPALSELSELSELSWPAGAAGQWSVHDLSIGSGGAGSGAGSGFGSGSSGSGSGSGSGPGSDYVAALSVEGAAGPGAPNRASRTSPAVSTPRAMEPSPDRG
ncbi:MAG: 4'-phosphopantetheinyl transferase family protein [Acidimicrobiales bacterium]